VKKPNLTKQVFTAKDMDDAVKYAWERFKTDLYDPLVKENKILKSKIEKYETKNPRGRPKGKKKSLSYSSLFVALGKSLGLKGKEGRPAKTSVNEMNQRLDNWEAHRDFVAKEYKVKYVTDKRAANYLLDRSQYAGTTQSWRRTIKDVLAAVKYWRKQTKRYTRSRNKPKTPR
jgi:hypothetical protein